VSSTEKARRKTVATRKNISKPPSNLDEKGREKGLAIPESSIDKKKSSRGNFQ